MTNDDGNDNGDGISFCNICLDVTDVVQWDTIRVCHKCLSNIKLKQKEEKTIPELPKEQIAGGIKDEL